jgi:hypothetical protein
VEAAADRPPLFHKGNRLAPLPSPAIASEHRRPGVIWGDLNAANGGPAMITIEQVVERYVHLGDDPSDDARERQITLFRAQLAVMSQVELIGRYLLLNGNRGERALDFLLATMEEPDDVFWPVLLDNWSGFESLHVLRRDMLAILRQRAARSRAEDFYSAGDRALWAALPSRVPVYRGCQSRRHARQLSWTTELAVTQWFARRFCPPGPIVASGEIDKSDIFFITNARRESEVVLDPYKVRGFRLEAAPIEEAAA